MVSTGIGTPSSVSTSHYSGGCGLPPHAGSDDLQWLDVPSCGVWYQRGVSGLPLGSVSLQINRIVKVFFIILRMDIAHHMSHLLDTFVLSNVSYYVLHVMLCVPICVLLFITSFSLAKRFRVDE